MGKKNLQFDSQLVSVVVVVSILSESKYTGSDAQKPCGEGTSFGGNNGENPP